LLRGVCWKVFTELLPGNALIKSVTICFEHKLLCNALFSYANIADPNSDVCTLSMLMLFIIVYKKLRDSYFTEYYGRMVTGPELYAGGPRFISLFGDRVPRLRLTWSVSVPMKYQNST
jgi:hypothetical protein